MPRPFRRRDLQRDVRTGASGRANSDRLTLEALDGELEAVKNFYADERGWAVRYLVVKTGGWLLGRHVLITPASVSEIDDRDAKLRVRLTRAEVEQSPPLDRATMVSRVSRAYEHAYYRYFRLRPYGSAVPDRVSVWNPTPRRRLRPPMDRKTPIFAVSGN